MRKERKNIKVAPEYIDKLNKVAEHNKRGQRQQAEYMIERDYKKITK